MIHTSCLRGTERKITHALLTCVVTTALGCGEIDHELPVVAVGRYVEIATDRDDPICGGTVAFMDRFLETSFALLGESPPDRVFVRYEWLDPSADNTDGARVEHNGDTIVIRNTIRVVDEHELTHAVHQQAWQDSAAFLHEGLAVLLDSRRPGYNEGDMHLPWFGTVSVDDLLEAPPLSEQLSYYHAYFLVSQIILDYGIDGLRDLWHAVPRDASATQVRAAFEALFDHPIDVLLQPWTWTYQDPGTGEVIEIEVDRASCDFAVCTLPARPFDENGVWTASGPVDCETDIHAIGPGSVADDLGFEPVWREHTLDRAIALPGSEFEMFPEGVRWQVRPCRLVCSYQDYARYPDGQIATFGNEDLLRIEIGADFDDFPTDTPAQLRYGPPSR